MHEVNGLHALGDCGTVQGPMGAVVTDFDLASFLPYQLAVVASRVSRGFADRYRAEFGLTIPEWRVLAHLAQAGTVSVREIQARVDMDKSKVSRAAARLEAAGLVEKRGNEGDRRLLDMRLTPQGQALFARIVPIAREYEAEVLRSLGPLSPDFRAALKRLLEGA
jgi:DNA-binding MarR family transcriptional regulator